MYPSSTRLHREPRFKLDYLEMRVVCLGSVPGEGERKLVCEYETLYNSFEGRKTNGECGVQWQVP